MEMIIMKRCKKVVTLFVSIILLLSFSTSVFANADMGLIVDGSMLTNQTVVEETWTNPMRGNILNQGTARLSDNGNGTVNVYGAVLGSVVCDKLILEMTLQRLQNGYWSDVKYFSDTAYNQGYLTKSYNVKVAGGYYYRMKAACVAQKGSTSESKMPVTDGIWID